MVSDALVVVGADIEGTNCVGETPIFRGNRARNVDTVRHMVELGASLHHRDAWGPNRCMTLYGQTLTKSSNIC